MRTAADEIRLRFADATVGIPKETRQALVGGYTTFERILPGPDRMYPDTDSPPTRVTEQRVAGIRAGLKPAPWVRFERYASWGVPGETSEFLIRRGGANSVDAVVERTGADPLTAAVVIGQRARAMARAGVPVGRLGPGEWVEVFDLYTGGRIPREAVPVVARRMATDGLKAAEAAAAEGIALVDRREWQRQLEDLSMAGYLAHRGDGAGKRLRFLAGRAMRLLGRRAPAKEVAAWVADRVEELAR